MSAKIHIATSKIWDYYWRNFHDLDDREVLIANNGENGMSLYVTAEGYYPQFVVYNEANKPLVWRTVRNSEECNTAAVFLMSTFIVSSATEKNEPAQHEENKVEEDPDEEIDDEQKILDTIYEREDELEMAMTDLLVNVFCEDNREVIKEAYGKDIVKDVLDDFLQYLYDQHGISVYRPTIITDENGDEVLAEFPYGWDDENEDESLK